MNEREMTVTELKAQMDGAVRFANGRLHQHAGYLAAAKELKRRGVTTFAKLEAALAAEVA